VANDDFKKALDEIANIYLSEQALREVGNAAIAVILLRTKKGLDADGQPFKPYTARYAKKRTARGLSTRPDLAVTGHMLGSMVPVPGDDEVEIEFNSPLEVAKAIGNSHYRDFFDIRQEKELQFLEDVVLEEVTKK
jgi:hypothetical protein